MYERKAKADTEGFAKSKQAAVGYGCLRTLRVRNKSASTVYIQLHDAAAIVDDGSVPSAVPVPLLAGQYYESDTPFDFTAGLNVCASSTEATKTLIAANDVWITAEYNY